MLKIVLAILSLVVWVSGKEFTNPISLHAADPWMVYHNGFYHLLFTTGTNYIGIKKAKTLEALKTTAIQVVYTFDGKQAWAPEIHPFDGKWYMYYTSCDKGGQDEIFCHRNRVAESAGGDPMGPYHHKADLIDPHDSNFELDPSVIKIKGKIYLLGSYVTDMQRLYIRELSNPYTAVGPKHMLTGPTYDWEQKGLRVNEGPEPLYHNNRTFVVYSASYCETPDYKLGLLEFVGTDPLNHEHWRKHPTPVFQRSDAHHVYGPGHNGFFKSPDGKEDWIVYHANDSPSGKCDANRSTRAKKFTWGADGLPVFGEPEAVGIKLQVPSGEN